MDFQTLGAVSTTTGVIAVGLFLLYKCCKEHNSSCTSKLASIKITQAHISREQSQQSPTAVKEQTPEPAVPPIKKENTICVEAEV
jgi:hypothetical protein